MNEKKLIDLQIRNAAILETILQTQIRILSKVKKENFDRTNNGIMAIVEETEQKIRAMVEGNED